MSLVVAVVVLVVLVMLACCRDQYREESSDALERMKPEDVYDSIRRTTADIRHYVKMESNTASPPTARTGCVASQRRDTSDNGVTGGSAASYHLPVVRSPDGRTRQRYNQVITFRVSCRTTRNVYWSQLSVCLSVCPLPHSHTTAWTRMLLGGS